MRIYLSIERDSLATVKTIWPLSLSEQSWTIAHLLEAVDKIFPLYAEQFGLAGYIVTIAGYECLHHHQIASICKEDDELVIRPLQVLELKARLRSGRHQLSYDGRHHTIDGLLFPNPASKASVRPGLHYPPRKRRKLSAEEQDVHMIEDGQVNEELEDGASDCDGSGTQEDEQNSSSLDEEDAESSDSKEQDNSNSNDDDSESLDSDDSDTSSVASSSTSGDSDDSDKSWAGLNVPIVQSTQDSDDQDDAGHEHPEAASHGNEETRQDHEHSGHALLSKSKTTSQVPTGIPFKGLEHTRRRNLRRRSKKRLQYLQAQEKLPATATFAELAEYDRNETPVSDKTRHDQVENSVNDTDTLEIMETTLPEKVNQSHTYKQVVNDSEAAILLARQQRLLNSLASGGITINREFDSTDHDDMAGDDEPPEQLSSRRPLTAQVTTANQGVCLDDGDDPAVDKQTDRPPIAEETLTLLSSSEMARRAKLDLNGSKRLLFGALGVRVPKTEADKIKTREKLAGRPQNGASKVRETSVKKPDLDHVDQVTENEDWRSKINLSAVECWDHGVTLLAPQFPFHQGWDPQYPRPHKKGKRQQKYVESYDKYNASGSDALNYDDVDEGAEEDAEYNNGENWEESALLNDVNEEEDGFPPLPEDIAALPLLSENFAAVGDYVVHTELVCSAATQWQPKVVPCTIQLTEKTATGWRVKLAQRDVPLREYDEDGKRVYDSLEMREMSDDEDEDSTVSEVVWNHLAAPRLLLRA